MIGKLTTVLLMCKDLSASEEFYVKKLGLGVTIRGEGFVVLAAGASTIVLSQGPKPAMVLGFEGADLPAVRKSLEADGLRVGPLAEHPGGKHYNVYDPDGNRVMISGSDS